MCSAKFQDIIQDSVEHVNVQAAHTLVEHAADSRGVNVEGGSIIVEGTQVPESIAALFAEIQITTSQPLTTFHLFSQMPKELRDKVYKLCAEPRELLIRIYEFVKFKLGTSEAEHYQVAQASKPRPAIIAATKEAYQLLLSTGKYVEIFQLNGRPGVIVNLEKDTLEFTLIPWVPIPKSILQDSLKHRSELGLIEVLSVNIPNLTHFNSWFQQNLKLMASLKVVNLMLPSPTGLVASYDDRRTTFTMTFDDMGNGREVYMKGYEQPDGVMMYSAGVDVLCIAAKTSTQDREGQQAILTLATTLERCLTDSEHFPSHLKVNIVFC